MRKHVDKHIAHSEDPGRVPKDPGETAPEDTPTLNEIHDAIDVIGEVFTRCSSLFEAAGMVTLEPQSHTTGSRPSGSRGFGPASSPAPCSEPCSEPGTSSAIERK